jgi:hypothetical protein
MDMQSPAERHLMLDASGLLLGKPATASGRLERPANILAKNYRVQCYYFYENNK